MIRAHRLQNPKAMLEHILQIEQGGYDVDDTLTKSITLQGCLTYM